LKNKYLYKCFYSECGHEEYLEVNDDDFRDRMCHKCHRLFKRMNKKLDFNGKKTVYYRR
jgi:hypothetical protein